MKVKLLAIIKIIYDSRKRRADKAVLNILKILIKMLTTRKN